MPIPISRKPLAPNPLMEGLKKAGSWAMTPLVDEETIQPMQDAIDSPSLDRSPGMARMQGFGAGALEGLRSLTSPMELVGMAGMGNEIRGMRAIGKGAMAAGRRMAPTVDVLEELPVKQVAPSMDDADALIGDLKRNLAKIPNATGRGKPPMETLGEVAPEFTPVGGEGMFNTAKQGLTQSRDAMQGLYEDLMRRGMGGRAR